MSRENNDLCPRTRTVHVPDRQRTGHGRVLSTSANCPDLVQSTSTNMSATGRVHVQAMAWTVHGQALATDVNCPWTVHGFGLSTSPVWPCPRFVREPRLSRRRPHPDSSCPFRRRFISLLMPASFPPMSSFDPATVRKAVAEFTPRRPQKFQDLLPHAMSLSNSGRSEGHTARLPNCSPSIVCRPAKRPSPCSVTNCLAKSFDRTNERDESAHLLPLRQTRMELSRPRRRRLMFVPKRNLGQFRQRRSFTDSHSWPAHCASPNAQIATAMKRLDLILTEKAA